MLGSLKNKLIKTTIPEFIYLTSSVAYTKQLIFSVLAIKILSTHKCAVDTSSKSTLKLTIIAKNQGSLCNVYIQKIL